MKRPFSLRSLAAFGVPGLSLAGALLSASFGSGCSSSTPTADAAAGQPSGAGSAGAAAGASAQAGAGGFGSASGSESLPEAGAGVVVGGAGEASAGAPAEESGGTASGGTASGGMADGGSVSSGGSAGSLSTGGVAAGGAAQGTYRPCMSTSVACKVMPLGDSITQGYRSSDAGGYRVELFKAAHQDKHNLTFVGSQSGGPSTVDGVAFPKAHEGHGGYTIDGPMGILPQVVNWMNAAKPDIVTLMIGTNDVNNFYAWHTESAADLSSAPTRLAQLIDAILGHDAHVLLYVAQITPTTLDAENADVQPYNQAIPALVKARADAGKHIVMVDMYTPFVNTANYKTVLLRGTSDTLHPANAGYTRMGDIWYAALESALP